MTERKNRQEIERLEHALRERTKELNCMHELGRIVEERGRSRDDILKAVVEILPPAWQYPDSTVARIVLGENEFLSGSFPDTNWRLTSDLIVNKEKIGFVEVAYTDEFPEADEGPFLKEERSLLDTIAERLAHVVERIKTGEELGRERNKLTALFNEIEDVIYVADPETHELVWVNSAFQNTWGKDVIGRLCFKVLQNRDEPCPFCTNDKIFGANEGTSHIWEFQNELSKHWYRCFDKAIKWPDGRMVRFEMATDITERKLMEEELSKQEKQFRLLAETAKDMIYRMAIPEGTYEYVSPASEVLFGYSPEEFYKNPKIIERIIHPDFHEYFQKEWAALLNGEMAPTYEYKIVHKSGDIRWMNQRNALIRDEAGSTTLIQGIVTDVTDSKEAAKRLEKLADDLRESNEELDRRVAARTLELETIIDSIPGLVFFKDTDNRYIRVNKFVADAHNAGKEDLEGKNCYDLYPSDTAKAYHDDDLEVINSGKPKLNIDEPWETESGTRWVNTSKIPYMNEDGVITGIIGVSMDITDRKIAEKSIERQNMIMEAINRIFRQALTCNTEEEVATVALGVAEKLTESGFGFIGEINENGLFDTIALSNPGWESCNIPGSDMAMLIRDMEIRGIWGMVLRDGKTYIVNDPEHHPERSGIPKGHPPLTSFLGVPFRRENKTVGMIALANKEGAYTEEDGDAVERLSVAFFEVLLRKRMEVQIERNSMLKAGQAEFSDLIRGNPTTEELCRNILTYLCNRFDIPTGLMYVSGEDASLRLTASYAYKPREGRAMVLKPGEGLVGQAALEKKPMTISEIPENYFFIESGLGETRPSTLVIRPVLHNEHVTAVFEFGMLTDLDDNHSVFLDSITESIATAIESSKARATQATLLEEAQQLTEELQAQQEELRTTNEELEEQTQRLKDSEERLRAQQEEQQVTNEELEEKNELLQRQKRDVDAARRQLQEKAEQLAMASKYKSEFLANMSHELRTPLNSLLLLAQDLSRNKDGNLTEDQIESAQVIHGSGSDLLNLINEILDLSKIEAGRVEIHVETVSVSQLAENIERAFRHLAEDKGLRLDIMFEEECPGEIQTDYKRSEQILRNLVGNAIKFTERGGVDVRFGQLTYDNGTWRDHGGNTVKLQSETALQPDTDDRWLSIVVRDTGIGIDPEHQKAIFEAFQQADGGTSRKYGGTGLGLSISRELAFLLGGEIQVTSEPGSGSTFTLLLPITHTAIGKKAGNKPGPVTPKPERPSSAPMSTSRRVEIPDDRGKVTGDTGCILIIEDDPKFAKVLYKTCHDRGFKSIIAQDGETGLELAQKFLPGGILLDIQLPGLDGWSILTALKEDMKTRHIPVHIISVEESATESIRKGAIGHATKPVCREELDDVFSRLEHVSSEIPKTILLVEDDKEMRQNVRKLIGDSDLKLVETSTGESAIVALRETDFDCIILDLGLPDMDGATLLEKIKTENIRTPPVIIHTAQELTESQEMELRKHAESIVIKDVRSQERLLDEVSLFLHRMVSAMPEQKKQVIRNLHETDELLKDKKVLIVDDDMRTTFAVSRLLSQRGMISLKAANGEQAISALEKDPEIDIVLMDIMMPVMDGYEAMKRIRSQDQFRNLPIIALTAKAMPEDRLKCIEAGANEYLKKPVDTERLISTLRVWLYR